MLYRSGLLISIISFSTCAFSHDPVKFIQNSGFLVFNGYYESWNFIVMTLNILANMPNRFQYFSLTNWEGAHDSIELNPFYSDRWIVSSTEKLAPFFKKIGMFYSVNPVLLQFKEGPLVTTVGQKWKDLFQMLMRTKSDISGSQMLSTRLTHFIPDADINCGASLRYNIEF